MKVLLGLVLCGLFALSLSAPVPEQVHLAFTGNVDEMAVTWVTLEPSQENYVRYGSQSGVYSTVLPATSHTFTKPKWQGWIHDSVMTNLVPGAKYFYQVGDGKDVWSQEFNFVALKPDLLPLRLGVFGDFGIQNDQSIDLLKEETERGMFDMILHIGDLAYDLHIDDGRVGDAFMRAIEPVSSHLPYMVCPGNHENHYSFAHYRERFSGIKGGQAMGNSNNNYWYSFNVANVHFVAISTEHSLLPWTEQAKWLRNDLAEISTQRDKYPWVIVFGHRPFYCSNNKRFAGLDCLITAPMLRRWLEPILYKYKVDVYLAGHLHSYERLWPVYNGKTTAKDYNDAEAPIQIISGAAGCKEMIDTDWADNDWSAFHASQYGYGHLTVMNNTHILWQQMDKDTKAPLDAAWIIKTKPTSGLRTHI